MNKTPLDLDAVRGLLEAPFAPQRGIDHDVACDLVAEVEHLRAEVGRLKHDALVASGAHGFARAEIEHLTLAPETVAMLRTRAAYPRPPWVSQETVEAHLNASSAWVAAGCPNLPTDGEE